MTDIDEHVAKDELVRLEQYIDEPILLIGGLAVQQYKRGRASKDIDLVCTMSQQKKFDSEAYPAAVYESETVGSDLRPAIIYKHNVTELRVFLGPKILEREPYAFIVYDDYFEESNPYKYNNIECTKIRVPAPHHLAFSKLISFMARRGTPKGHQDLIDFSDLTNHKSFSLIRFLSYAKRVRSEDQISKFLSDTKLNTDEKEILSSSSIFAAQTLMSNFGVDKEAESESRTTISGSPEELLNRFSQRVAASVEDRGLSTVRAVTHTGQVSIRALAKILNATKVRSEDVKVLIRTPDYEDYFRSTAITRTIEDIKDFGYQYKFYSSPPFVHGFLVEYLDGSHDFLYSFYLHQSNGRTKIDESAYFESGQTAGSFYGVFNSWFDYHWGKANNYHHTIVFDFDDTLADTGFIQVEAWNDAILNLPAFRRDLLTAEVLASIKTNDLRNLLLKRFQELQIAGEIARSLFESDVADDTMSVAIDDIQTERLRVRNRKTKEAELFDGVLEIIPKLAKKYYLSIVSATDEKVIRDFLRGKGLLEFFSHVYGKHAPYEGWSEHIAIKSQNLIKMSTILGVPLSRMIYIGDSNGDFVASRQIGIKFVEARLNKKNIGAETLIKGAQSRIYFNKMDELESVLDQIEADDDP